jgi:hypothetical protein
MILPHDPYDLIFTVKGRGNSTIPFQPQELQLRCEQELQEAPVAPASPPLAEPEVENEEINFSTSSLWH